MIVNAAQLQRIQVKRIPAHCLADFCKIENVESHFVAALLLGGALRPRGAGRRRGPPGRGRPPVSYFGGTEQAKVFLADLPGARFSQTKVMRGVQVAVSGSDNGQAIVIRPNDREVIVAGYRCPATLKTELIRWPALERLRVERGRWIGSEWREEGAANYRVNQVYLMDNSDNKSELRVSLNDPRVIRVYW